jgi:FkbH-like protein
MDLLAAAIACAILQEGVVPVLYVAPYGTLVQEALNPGSDLHAFRPQLAVLVPDWRNAVPPLPVDTTAYDADAATADQVRLFQSLWSALEAQSCRIVQHTLVPPPELLRGVADRRLPASAGRRVHALNQALLDAGDGRVIWLEADQLATRSGLQAWSAPRFYHAGKFGFDPRFLVDYLPWFRGAWRAVTGRTKKVLAVDLDDTLWGGAIGDLGADGVALGPAHGAGGEAFAAWQDYVAGLGRRGVILAVCSKNAPELALAGFEHPHGALRQGDFAAIVCSWDDKATGLGRIAEALSVGTDAIVFADDNPSETALVRQFLPEVETVDLGTDPARFIERLEAGHWFDLQAYTGADFGRAEAYTGRRLATEARSSAAGLDEYLAGLEMTGRLEPAIPADLARMAQLEARTNQFNLTTRRYSQAQLATFLASPGRLLLTFRLRDRFADHDLVSTLNAVQEQDRLRIDSWVMSCRVFARSAEQFILAGLLQLARARGLSTLVGEYVPTERNGVVADLYARLGFERSGEGLWQRSLDLPAGALGCRIADGTEAASR